MAINSGLLNPKKAFLQLLGANLGLPLQKGNEKQIQSCRESLRGGFFSFWFGFFLFGEGVEGSERAWAGSEWRM